MSNQSKKSLADLLRKWVARGRRVPARRPTAQLRLEEVEHRVVPATTPAVTATAAISVPNTTGAFTPQVVADPLNPNTLAMIVAQPNGVLVQISFDGGVSWTKMRDTNSPFNANPNLSNVPQTFAADQSRGKLVDPTLPLGSPRFTRGYTNVSEPTIAFTRGGSVYVGYLEHNLAKTSGAMLVERFDINRTAESFVQVDLDRARDWDNDPVTPASERWQTASLPDNRAYVLYQWTDNGTVVNRPANIFIGVDTNPGSYDDPDDTGPNSGPVTDPFVQSGGGETIFVAWNMVASAPSVESFQNLGATGAATQLGYVPNIPMLAVGRVDPAALIDRPDPNAPESPSNPRQAAFLFSTPVPVNDGGHFLGAGNTAAVSNTGGAAPVVTFTPASLRTNGTVAPGTVNVIWGTAGNNILSSSFNGINTGTNNSLGPVSSSYTFRSNDNPDSTNGSSTIVDGFDILNDNPDFDAPRTTTFQLRNVDLLPFAPVSQGGGGGFFDRLDDLDLSISISHPNLSHLDIVLRSPDNIPIQLVQNRINGDNSVNRINGIPVGLAGTDLGVLAGIQGNTAGQPVAIPGNPVGTVFSDEAAREIYDPINLVNYTGSYRAEAGSLAAFYGRTAAQLSSNNNAFWQLEVTDHRDDRIIINGVKVAPIQLLRNWSLTFTSRLDNSDAGGRLGADGFLTNGTVPGLPTAAGVVGVGAPARVSTVPGTNQATTTTGPLGGDQTFPTLAGAAPSVSPTFGVGPGISAAFDNSLGAFSPFSGRLYVVYTRTGPTPALNNQTDTNVYIVASDNNGASWFHPMGLNANGTPIPFSDDSAGDNFSEGRRVQYQPSVTVDSATGMVVVSWYDARTDANNSRVATYVATSIDGGATWSPASPVNTQKFAIDAITGRRVNLEPVPTNVAQMPVYNQGSAYQYGGTGVRQSVVAFGGVIKPFWAGNNNAAGSSVFTANVRTAAGPRVVESDLGAVTGESNTGTDNGTALMLDEDAFPNQITYPAGQGGATRTTYNDTFTADGVRRIDGFRVVFDRPVFFGPGTTQANAVAAAEGFGVEDVEVRFRAAAGLLDTATQGARLPLLGVYPIGGYTDSGSYFATAYFVQFATPQTAVGTYSYAISPNVTDRIRSQGTAVFIAQDTPLTLADPGTVESQIVVPSVSDSAGNPLTVRDLQVGVNLSHTFLSQLRITLIGPDPDGTGPAVPQEIDLFFGEGNDENNLINTRFADSGIPSPYPFNASPNFNNFNGIYAPYELSADPYLLYNPPQAAQGLAAFNGQLLAGTWTLRVQDLVATSTGSLNSWSLKFRDTNGDALPIVRTGNGLDQDADSIQKEPQNDVYSVPRSLSGAPFTGPFDSATRPIVQPGAHVVRTYPGGQFATAVTATAPSTGVGLTVAERALRLDVTLDREVDVTTLTLAGITSVIGPGGALRPTAVEPTNVVNGGTKTFRLVFAAAPTAGSYSVTLNERVYVTDDLAQNATVREVFVRFDRDILPASFTPGNVLRMSGPIGGVSLAGVTVTAVGEDRVPLPAGSTAARLFRITFDQPQLVLTPAASFSSIPITLVTTPSVGPLTLSDIRLTGPDGVIQLTDIPVTDQNGVVTLYDATLTGAGTNYVLNFPAPIPQLTAGTYVVDITPTPSTVRRVQNNDFQSIPITLAAAPLSGSLTLGDITRVTGPNGNVSLSGASLTGSGTAYVLTFGAVQVAGEYVIQLNPNVLRGVAVVNSGVRLSGPYNIEFGSNPAIANDAQASIRAADRPQALVNVPTGTTQPSFFDVSFTATTGTLTLADVLRVVGPTGQLTPTSLTQQNSTTYRLAFATPLPAGQYVVDFAAGTTTATGVASTNTVPFTIAQARTLTTGDIVSVTGPGGAVSLGGMTLTGGPDSYTLTFPANLPAGTYTVRVAQSAVRTNRVTGSGLPMDNNFNAGVDLTTGKAIAGETVVQRVFQSTAGPVSILPATEVPGANTPGTVATTTAEMAITISEDFVITQDDLNKIEVLLNISYPDVWKLRVELIPPPQNVPPADRIDSILLYNGADDAANGGPGQQGGANFTGTRLLDRVGDTRYPSILDGVAPFESGPFNILGYTPQSPLSVLADPTRPFSAKGTWVLRVTNSGTDSTVGQISSWALTLPRTAAQTGLGERVADRFQAGFRVFTATPTDELSRDTWTPLGPGSANEGATAGRVTSAVVDPSDPSGNTVYIAGASGGVWKTTNFLTTDIDGPHYVPLTDFGPTTAIHIQSLAVFGRNNDPSQSIVFALTGEGNTVGLGNTTLTDRGRTATGVGVLRSVDGGRTWAVLTHSDNRSPDPTAVPGAVKKASQSPANPNAVSFIGTSGFKIVVDPSPNPSPNPNAGPDGSAIVYMAVSGGNAGAAGVWRSTDSGLTWTLVRAGQATDVILSPASAPTFNPLSQQTVTDGNLQRLYASFRGDGVYFTDSAPIATSLDPMSGNQTGQLPTVRDVNYGVTGGLVVTTGVQTGNLTPNGGQGRIALAAPALTNDPLRNFFYRDWLYAVVVTPAGGLAGLYQTKDAGENWTRVRIPLSPGVAGGINGTNDESLADYDLFQSPIFQQGNYDVAITVDPVNPAVIYLSGVGFGTRLQANLVAQQTPAVSDVVLGTGIGSGSAVGGSMKIDLTKIKDTQNFTFFNNSDPGGGTQTTTLGGAAPRFNDSINNQAPSGNLVKGFTGNFYGTDFINASRDPNNPFTTNSTLQVGNVGSMTNNGTDVFWEPFQQVLAPGTLRAGGGLFNAERAGSSDVHNVFAFLDPTTGQSRFIYSGDQGVFTGVERGDGTLTTAAGFDKLVTGSRNGNLQLTQFYSGAVQPSQLAADVAGALFYGMAQDNGFLVSDPRLLANSSANWRGPTGDGAWVEVDPLGSGRAFQYRSPTDYGIDSYNASNPLTGGLPQEFIREFNPGRASGDPDFGGGIPRTGGNNNGLIKPGDFVPPTNAAYGGQWPTQGGVQFAINPINPNVLVIQSSTGRVYRTTDGGSVWIEVATQGTLAGGPGSLAFGASSADGSFYYVGTSAGQVYVTTTGGAPYTNITAGLTGGVVRRIVPNPAANSRDVFAVTDRGVFYKADGTSTAAPWVNITGNLFNLTRAAFNDPSDLVSALPQAGRALNALAVDWRFADPNATTLVPPELYVAGIGGVFKSSDMGATWRVFPSLANEGATSDGGYLPTVEVTDLDLSIGNLNSTSGKYEAGGLNLLMASTYGRGSWAIRLSDSLPPQSFIAGPAVTAVSIPTQPPGTPANTITVIQVQFNSPLDPATAVPKNFRLERLGTPTNTVVTILAVTPVPGFPNRFAVTFEQQPSSTTQQYRLTVGFNPDGSQVPTITDPSGNRMNQNANTVNGQPGPNPQGDQYVQQLVLDAVSDRLETTAFPGTLVAGVLGAVTIEQKNPDGTRDTSATSALTVSTTGPGALQLFSDAAGTMPITNPQLAAGVVTFYVRLTVVGSYPITVTTTGAVNATGFVTNVTAAAAAKATLSPAAAAVNSPNTVTYTVTFQDAFNNATNYAGQATISYAGAAVNPVSPTSRPIDTAAGQNSFTVTTQQSGTVSVTVSVPQGGSTIVSNTANILVNTGSAATVTITPVGSGPFTAGSPIAFTVVVTDASGNVVDVDGPLTVTPGGGGTVLPATPTLTDGRGSFTVTYGTPGSFAVTVTSGSLNGTSGTFVVAAQPPRPSPTEGLTGVYAAATDKSVRDAFGNIIQEGSPLVSVFNPNGSGLTTLLPFPPGYAGEVDAGSQGFTGGIRLSVADVTGDGVADYVIGSGPTITATVQVINGATNRTVLTLRPFADFKGGVFVSTGDLTGDGLADIVITPDEGGGPRVTIIRGGTFTQVANFFGIDDPSFRGGARAAMGDINADGFADLVVSAGFGGGPRISIYDGAALKDGNRLNVIGDFFLFEEALRNGAYVAVGDTNGDGFADLIGGAGPGGAPRVLVLDGRTLLERGSQGALLAPLFNGFLGDVENRGGVRVAAKNLNADKFADVLIGSGEGGGSRVEAYRGDGFSLLQGFDLLPGFSGGVFVG